MARGGIAEVRLVGVRNTSCRDLKKMTSARF